MIYMTYISGWAGTFMYQFLLLSDSDRFDDWRKAGTRALFGLLMNIFVA